MDAGMVLLHTWGYMSMQVYVYVDASWCQASALGSVPQEPPTSDFQTGSLIDLEFSKSSQFARQQAQGSFHLSTGITSEGLPHSTASLSLFF